MSEQASPLLCATDFSEHATRAAEAAAHVGKKLGTTLLLAHAVEGVPADPESHKEVLSDAARGRRMARLRRLGDHLRHLGVKVEETLVVGDPHDAIVELAERANARMIFLGALGTRAPGTWLLGSVVERTAQRAAVPTVVVRDVRVFERLSTGGEPARVLLGVDRTESSHAALRWLEAFHRQVPCDVTAAYVAWPPFEHKRLGIRAALDLETLADECRTKLEEEVSSQLVAHAPGLSPRIAIEQGFGRVDTHLLSIANRDHTELIVVGNHQRAGLSRLWHGSVSRGVLHSAETNVVCVPMHLKAT